MAIRRLFENLGRGDGRDCTWLALDNDPPMFRVGQLGRDDAADDVGWIAGARVDEADRSRWIRLGAQWRWRHDWTCGEKQEGSRRNVTKQMLHHLNLLLRDVGFLRALLRMRCRPNRGQEKTTEFRAPEC